MNGRSETVRKALGLTLFSALLVALLWGLGSGAPVVRPAFASGADDPTLARATFAGGCFWCMEPPFDELVGVVSTTSGYAGGNEVNPTYRQVSSGRTGHTEVVQVVFDPAKVGYEELLEVFWRNIDPTVKDRQFCDSGSQYRTAIFYDGEAQKSASLASATRLRESGRFAEIHTEVEPLEAFYPAEDYHQDFYKKNPDRYYSYRRGCRRDERLTELWGG